MAISNKSKCAVRCMMRLALKGKGTMTVQEIFEKEDLSKRYLEQVFSDLKRAGLVGSVKGKNGGYHLARKPHEIRTREIVAAVEGGSLFSEPTDSFRRSDLDAILEASLWGRLDNAVLGILDNMTLQDLVSRYNDTCSNMFYI